MTDKEKLNKILDYLDSKRMKFTRENFVYNYKGIEVYISNPIAKKSNVFWVQYKNVRLVWDQSGNLSEFSLVIQGRENVSNFDTSEWFNTIFKLLSDLDDKQANI